GKCSYHQFSVFCQTELIQPGSMTLQPEQPLTLSCKASGYSLTSTSDCTGVNHQLAGKALEWIGLICHDGNTSSSTVLTGHSLLTEDTAVYYCARYPQGYKPAQDLHKTL
uniref:Immunoglobulin V-set domain-containing protein n=1 Tax=Hucho hucho TaxID=62062 RepID=A0A4W5RX48_9TELE